MEKLCELSGINKCQIFLPTYYLYKKTMKDNYNACDIWVRFLAIDNYYKKNNDGFQIYNEVAFRNLIKSFETNGFLKEYPLQLNKDFMVIDGAHRLALALYMGIEMVPVCFNEKYYNVDFDYSLQWMIDNGFGKYKEKLLEQYNRIKEKYEKGQA